MGIKFLKQVDHIIYLLFFMIDSEEDAVLLIQLIIQYHILRKIKLLLYNI